MSITIHYRKVTDKNNDPYFANGTSSSLAILAKVRPDLIFGIKDVDILRAMMLASNDSFYGEIADTIETLNGAIKIYGRH